MGQEGHHVSAIEANPESAVLLNASIAINNLRRFTRVKVAAASAVHRRGQIHVPCGNAAHATLVTHSYQYADACGSHEIRTAPLKHLLGYKKNVDVIKVDVEGNEFAVLCGALPLLQRSPQPALVFEFVPAWINDNDSRDNS